MICYFTFGEHLNRMYNVSLINLLKLKTYLCTNSFNTQKFYALPTMHMCVLRGSHNKERLFFFTALTITEAESVYCAVRTGSLKSDRVSSLKG